jgi:hypothetical protein
MIYDHRPPPQKKTPQLPVQNSLARPSESGLAGEASAGRNGAAVQVLPVRDKAPLSFDEYEL